MKVIYLQQRIGANLTINIGDTLTVSTEKGERLIALGFAEEVKGKNPRKAVEVVKTVISNSSTKKKKK